MNLCVYRPVSQCNVVCRSQYEDKLTCLYDEFNRNPLSPPLRVHDSTHTNTPLLWLPPPPPSPSLSSLPGIRYGVQALKYCRGTRVTMKKTCLLSVLTTMSDQCYGNDAHSTSRMPGLGRNFRDRYSTLRYESYIPAQGMSKKNKCRWTFTVRTVR